MADFISLPATAGTSIGFSITADQRITTPNDPTSITWTEITPSLAADTAGFMVNIGRSSRQGIFWVGTGAAGSEEIIAILPANVDDKQPLSMFVPVPVNAGARVAVGLACEDSGITWNGQLTFIKASIVDNVPPFSRMEFGPFDLLSGSNYGKWATVDPGGTANTKGSYTEISEDAGNVLNGDSVAHDYAYFGFLVNSQFNGAVTGNNCLIDIAKGAASSEVHILEDYYLNANSSEVVSTGGVVWTPGSVSMGDRISARLQCDITDATDRLKGFLLAGLR